MRYQDAPTLFSWLTNNPVKLTSSLLDKIEALPDLLQFDGNELNADEYKPEALNHFLHNCSNDFSAAWHTKDELQLFIEFPDSVKQYQDKPIESVETVHTWLQQLPFEVCIGGLPYIDWISPRFEYKTTVLAGQYPLGWLLAFKGEGHKYLISNRWLEHAPLKVHRQGDTTYLQFHQLSVPASVALEQAVPAWAALDTSPEGGFLPENLSPETGTMGQYDDSDGSMSVVVVGRDPSLRELQEACVARNMRGLEDGREIKQIIYVFMEPERAQKHLHQLWLREIECHTFIDGKEVNLSESYKPPAYNKPSWVVES